jgi:uncharacterized protein YcsI (UPF0317 family)
MYSLAKMASTHGARVRADIRRGKWTGHTSGVAPDLVQGTVVILPADAAGDFLRYCQRNPKPCPLLAVSEPGEFTLAALGHDIDIRTDVPQYRVWRQGKLDAEPTSIVDLWRDDLVTFVIGCSFSFEQALLDDGIALRHIAEGKNVAMYRTGIETVPAGRFSGPLVVSMRPLRATDAIRAIQITSRFPGKELGRRPGRPGPTGPASRGPCCPRLRSAESDRLEAATKQRLPPPERPLRRELLLQLDPDREKPGDQSG